MLFEPVYYRYEYVVFNRSMLLKVFLEGEDIEEDVIDLLAVALLWHILHHDVLEIAELLFHIAVVFLILVYLEIIAGTVVQH